MPNDNRRQHQRLEIHLAIEIVTENNIYEGITNDISKGGMSTELNGPLYKNDDVQIGFFKLSEGIEEEQNSFGVFGKIVWSRVLSPGKFSAGIKFQGLSEEEISYLGKLLGESRK
ncbi:MAG: PilZ domain-containing protein [Deltaproteobacteria bacterium]|jgi:c-di-GMP-binding flagellar brake protein YcgR|nr:PilZ domain-containing protein [Deltaproteobacteria bacterium]